MLDAGSTRNHGEKHENPSVGAIGVNAILLADWVTSIQSFVQVFIWVYVLLIFAYVLTSWIRLPYSPTMNRIQRFLYDVCEPYLRIFRRILPSFGPLDLSPMVAVIVLFVAGQLVIGLLGALE